MPKITKHGGASNYPRKTVVTGDVDGWITRDFEDTLGETESKLPVEVEEVVPSVGNNSSLSSSPTPTIDELLKGSHP
jgi:hypothetical protein